LRPDAVHEAVADDGFDQASASGNLLDDASIAAAQVRVKDEQPPRAGRAVVTARNADHLVRMARNRFRVEKRAGEPGTAAPEFALVGSVWIHVKQDARIRVGLVGVFPAQV
jgi:hypothetical protein